MPSRHVTLGDGPRRRGAVTDSIPGWMCMPSRHVTLRSPVVGPQDVMP